MVGRSNRRGWGWIRRLPSKRWQASYVGPDTARHTAPYTFTAKMDAEAWLADERRLIERQEWTPPAQRAPARTGVLTVGQYSRSWVEHRSLKARTRTHYQGLLERQLAPLVDVQLRGLTPAQVRSWHASMDPSRPTIRAHAYGLLHAILATAVSDGMLDRNPCAIPRAMKTSRRREPVILSVTELGRLADAIVPKYRALVLISAWCGLRWGEVTELRRSDVSAGAEVLSVGRAAVHRGGCVVSTPKAGKGRSVVVPPHIRADVDHHLDTFVDKETDALLFAPARGGCHLRDKVFAEHFVQALAKIGRQGVRVHDLRHFCGTQTARVGSLAETMSRLGHSTVSASLLYQGIVSGRDAEIAYALSELAKNMPKDVTTQPGDAIP